MLRDIKISTRLFLGFTLMIGFIMAIGGFSVIQSQFLSGLTIKLYRHPFTVSNAVRDINIDIIRMHRDMKNIVLTQDPAILEKSFDDINAAEKRVVETFQVLKERFLGDQKDVDSLRSSFLAWKTIREEIIALARAGKREEAIHAAQTKGNQHVEILEKTIQKISEFARDKATEFFEHSQKQVEQSIYLLTGFILTTILFGILGAWWTVRTINHSLKLAIKSAHFVAQGDLNNTIQITTKNEIGQLLQALDTMQTRLIEVIQTMKETAHIVDHAAEDITQGNTNLSQRTEQQAASLEETSSSMEEMTSTVRQNADNTQQAKLLAEQARDVAQQGGAVVNTAVLAMNEINQSSKRMSDIIGVINDIAFQTNLLALNAAVEAARAGEQGRGFAVVAGEVRHLAQRSSEASKEIKKLIEDSIHKAEEGMLLVNQSGKMLQEIVASVKKVSEITAEIAAASLEQTAGIQQVNRVVMQMDEMTQQNAALVEEAASASESLKQQVKLLQQQIEFFKIPVKITPHHTVPSQGIKNTPNPTRSGHQESHPWRDF